MEREETAPGQLRTGPVAVVAPEQLVAAAHGEEGRAAGDRVLECRAFGFDVGCDERLLAILAAADVEQVDLSSVHALADADRGDLELMAASCGTLGQHGDVAAVGVDVQVVRVEMPDADLHAARSQYGRANPRSETIFRSASMAVYVGRTASSPPAGVSSSPRSSASSGRGHDFDLLRGKAAVAEAQASSAARSPEATSRSSRVEQRFEIDVPDPGNVPPVGDPVVQRDEEYGGDPRVDERPHDFVRAGGVLDQEDEDVSVAQRDPLEAAEGGAEPLEARLDPLQLDPHRLGQRRGRERVVDVVEAGEAQADARRPLGRHEVEGGALEPDAARSLRATTSSGGRACPHLGQR